MPGMIPESRERRAETGSKHHQMWPSNSKQTEKDFCSVLILNPAFVIKTFSSCFDQGSNNYSSESNPIQQSFGADPSPFFCEFQKIKRHPRSHKYRVILLPVLH